jgi:hypothetical protein
MGQSADSANIVTGAGRPRIHASDSVRVAEFRSKHARLDVPISLPIGKTIEDLALYFGCSKADVVRSLLRFALTNRDWRKQGLLWGD